LRVLHGDQLRRRYAKDVGLKIRRSSGAACLIYIIAFVVGFA